MKVEIDAKGMLIIESENALESYALRQYCKENKIPEFMLVVYASEKLNSDIKV